MHRGPIIASKVNIAAIFHLWLWAVANLIASIRHYAYTFKLILISNIQLVAVELRSNTATDYRFDCMHEIENAILVFLSVVCHGGHGVTRHFSSPRNYRTLETMSFQFDFYTALSSRISFHCYESVRFYQRLCHLC